MSIPIVSHTPKDIPLHPPWMARAACRDSDNPDQWFPEVGAAGATGEERADARRDRRAAKRVCAWCPVRRECLLYDMLFPAPQPGIWAGLTLSERETLRKTIRKNRQSAA